MPVNLVFLICIFGQFLSSSGTCTTNSRLGSQPQTRSTPFPPPIEQTLSERCAQLRFAGAEYHSLQSGGVYRRSEDVEHRLEGGEVAAWCDEVGRMIVQREDELEGYSGERSHCPPVLEG